MIGRWTKWMEKKIFKVGSLLYIYESYYKNIVSKEIQLANISERDRVLCIGGGAVPCTAIQLASHTGANVEVIDVDRLAVEKARELIVSKGLEGLIDVRMGRGESIDSSSYDVVHLALQVAPKDLVVEQVWKNAKEGSRIVIRRPKKILSMFYSPLSKEFLERHKDSLLEMDLKNSKTTMDQVLVMVKN